MERRWHFRGKDGIGIPIDSRNQEIGFSKIGKEDLYEIEDAEAIYLWAGFYFLYVNSPFAGTGIPRFSRKAYYHHMHLCAWRFL
jgi:hypothetical protein